MLQDEQIKDNLSDKIILFLEKNNLSQNLITHEVVRSMEDVKRQLPLVDPSDMIKSVLVEISDKKKQYILCGIPSNKMLDFEILSRFFNIPRQKIKLVNPKKVKEITGLDIGCLTPLLMPHNIQVYLDSSFDFKQEVWCGVGTYNHSLRLSSEQIRSICNFQYMDLIDKANFEKAVTHKL